MTDAQGPWKAVNPPEMAKAIGYANAVVTEGGRHVFLAGQIDMDTDGKVAHPGDLLEQVKGAYANIARVLAASGARPEHMTRMRIYVTHVDAYKALGREIGAAYRACFGRWFPAMTLVGVTRLYDEGALIEIEVDAVVP
ncbi:MAG: RidA family protein [Planctomycetota bacterium]|nr:RidA family protein [Planctomycetota bacterium]